jgi:hypothetical protein
MKTPRNAMSTSFHEGLMEFDRNPLCTAGLLGRWRPISGHFQRACLANSSDYWRGRRVETDSELDHHHPKSLMKYPG